ncbi:hypothetical protein MJO10_31790, partial [Salmonella enterica subsp. enterica serovar Anatum]|nr:hypothetical protein [Salmonella enterica subsp. enterica serovar Anatum]
MRASGNYRSAPPRVRSSTQRNVRLTPQRLEVLHLMSLQQGAISAYDLLDLLRETEPQAKP